MYISHTDTRTRARARASPPQERHFHTVMDLRKDEAGTHRLSIVPPFSVQNLLPVAVNLRLSYVPAGVLYDKGTQICTDELQPAQEHEVCACVCVCVCE